MKRFLLLALLSSTSLFAEAVFPPPIEPQLFQFEVDKIKVANTAAQVNLASLIMKNATDELEAALLSASVYQGTDSEGRAIEVRRDVGFYSEQSLAGGIQRVVIFKDGRKRLESERNFVTGEFSAIIIGSSVDRFAPAAFFYAPINTPGRLKQVMYIDIGNNKKNDFRAAQTMLKEGLKPLRFISLKVFQGGLNGEAQARNLLKRFGGF